MLQTALIGVLLLVDAGLVLAFWHFMKRRTIEADIVAELAEERRTMERIRDTIREEIRSGQTRIREASDRVSRLAMEAEQEVKGSSGILKQEVEQALTGFGGSLDKPLADLAVKQEQIAGLLRKTESVRSLLRKQLERAEMMCKALDEKAPFDEVLNELREKKYTDARSLLAQGLSPLQVAMETGLGEAEVRILAGITNSGGPTTQRRALDSF